MALNIIGAGLGRTGTASLKVALEALDFGCCYHMSEILQDPSRTQDWVDAADGKANWPKIFQGYGATVDNPGCGFWKELAEFYPNAKVILTIRDANQWFESTNETIHSREFAAFIKNSPFGEMVQKTIWNTMKDRMQDREFMVRFFEDRTKEIQATIPSDRLLVYQVKEGWAPLCKFLNVPVPDMDFPRINSRDETRNLIENMIAASGENLSDEAMTAAGRAIHGDKAD